MPLLLRLAIALELLLLLLEKVLPEKYNCFPLFGDHFTQVAVLIISAVVSVELRKLFREAQK
jgi:hypothetical protein